MIVKWGWLFFGVSLFLLYREILDEGWGLLLIILLLWEVDLVWWFVFVVELFVCRCLMWFLMDFRCKNVGIFVLDVSIYDY